MTKPRIPETDHGIQGEITVAQYDQMQRSLRDRGWIETPSLLKHNITKGLALEIGHGPGYLGLEWLKQTTGTRLVGLDISPDMKALAQRNAQAHGLADRTQYHLGNCDQLPFDENAFDAVFTSGSLHEWANPCGAFDEICARAETGRPLFHLRFAARHEQVDASIFMVERPPEGDAPWLGHFDPGGLYAV